MKTTNIQLSNFRGKSLHEITLSATTSHYEAQNLEILEYCRPHLDQMWAAKIASIILDCDFRETKTVIENYLALVENYLGDKK